MGKTGSSALQVAFVRNRAALAAAGVRYPSHVSDRRAVRGRTVSGNGLALLELLTTGAGGDLAPVLAELTSSSEPTVLYSSEFLWYFRPDRLSWFVDQLAAVDVDLVVVAYVRDIAGLVVSSYRQMVKRARYVNSLSQYVQEYAAASVELGLAARPQSLVELLGPERVLVRHYDSERTSLVSTFFTQVLGVAAPDEQPGEFNRSLTPLETEWMRYLNLSLSDNRAALIASEALTARPPLLSSGSSISAEDLAVLELGFGPEVAWINEHFLDGRLSLLGSATVSQSSLAQIGDVERHLLDVLSDFANRRSERREKRANSKD